MSPRRRVGWVLPALAALTPLLGASPALAQEGFVLTGVGAVNRSMGGAATAAPLDASGALYWNPATITGLPRSEMEFGLEVLYPQSRVSSSIPAGALGNGVPPVGLAGSTRGENGVFPLPSFGLVYRSDDPSLVYGLGVFAAGGFSADYAADPTNPVFSPRPPVGVGLGSFFTNFQVLQIVPTVAYQLDEGLSVGFAPTLDLAFLQADPGLVAPPDDANGDGVPTYPALTHTRYHFGGGFQAGVYYSPAEDWHFGATVKSPQWFEPFRWHAADELGRPRTVRFRADYPMILSAGTSYTGFERLLLALDFRFVDFRDTTGFRASGFDAQGALQGLGWNSVFGIALGAQYRLTDALALRAGYTWNQSPIPSDQASVNIGSATIGEHAVYAGATYRLSRALLVSLAYMHVFENTVSGPLVSPVAGVVPGTSVENAVAADSLILGLTVQFGGGDCRHDGPGA
jgi:long-chain fatty acid transport protein